MTKQETYRVMPDMPRYRAKDILTGEYVEGYYVEYHTSDLNTKTLGYDVKTHPSLFNDDLGERSKGSYWHEINPSTLTKVEKEPNLFNI